MSKQTIKKLLRNKIFLSVVMLSIALLNIFNLIFHGLPEVTSSTIASARKQVTSDTSVGDRGRIFDQAGFSFSTPSTYGRSSVSVTTLKNVGMNVVHVNPLMPPAPTPAPVTLKTSKKLPLTTENRSIPTEPDVEIQVNHYHLVKDARYDYQFRFEFNTSSANDTHRVMILLNGSGRTCTDYWEFPVGRRMLATLRTYRFSILAICSKRKKFDANGPITTNAEVKWIYLSLQKWINEVYYKQFRYYPRLYTHGVSRGSKLAALLSRVLPIQAQIFTIYPADPDGLLTRSQHHIDMQNRLQLDPVFANWYYFDFCYYKKPGRINATGICPFESNYNYLQPVPPSYFIHVQYDPIFKESHYTLAINALRGLTFEVGGILLNQTESVKFHILPPDTATPLYMQQTFDIWYSKPYASEFFYQHFIEPKKYPPANKSRKTCLCMHLDFKYYELHPDITATWTKKKQEEYSDYVKDVTVYEKFFCEDICGDLIAHHAMFSRSLDKAFDWINLMDNYRHSFYIKDYLARPLRIWMYERDLLNSAVKGFSSQKPDWNNLSKSYQMYSPEYYLQDYFQQLNKSNNNSRHNLKWTDNPLLADYFIIPNDLMFHYFYSESAKTNMTDVQFQKLRDTLNNAYFDPLLKEIRTNFPYWTMAKHANQMGSNHIIAMLGGRNMGFLNNRTQNKLKNVIQFVFTGIRQDLLEPNAQPSYKYRNMTVVYRHGYDVIIPQFTRLTLNESTVLNLDTIVKKKKRLFFFAGALAHAMTYRSARPLLSYIWKDIKEKQTHSTTTEIQGKQYDTITIIDGHIKPDEYIESMQSSVFALCPEGFLPWSPRLYEAIQMGAIPLILADNIVLPFERFIDWQSFSAKMNVSNIRNMTGFVHRINNFEQYIVQKLQNAQTYSGAFQWPYSAIDENRHNKHVFLPHEDMNGSANNVFHYISLELRCRRLEQLYGLTSESLSMESMEAQQRACKNHSIVCPCHNAQRTVAFQEYI